MAGSGGMIIMRGALNVITSLLLGIGSVAVAVPSEALAAPVSTVVTGAVVTGQVRSAGQLVAGACRRYHREDRRAESDPVRAAAGRHYFH